MGRRLTSIFVYLSLRSTPVNPAVIMVKTKFLNDFTKTAEILMGFTIGKISQVGCFYLPHRIMSLITQKVLNFLIFFLFFLFYIKMPQFKHTLAYIRLFLVLAWDTEIHHKPLPRILVNIF